MTTFISYFLALETAAEQQLDNGNQSERMMAGHGVGRHSAVMLRQLGQKRLAQKQQKHQRHIAYYRVIKQQSEILIDQLHQVSPFIALPLRQILQQTERETFAINHSLNCAVARLRSAREKRMNMASQSSCVYFRPALLFSVLCNLFSFSLSAKD